MHALLLAGWYLLCSTLFLASTAGGAVVGYFSYFQPPRVRSRGYWLIAAAALIGFCLIAAGEQTAGPNAGLGAVGTAGLAFVMFVLFWLGGLLIAMPIF